MKLTIEPTSQLLDVGVTVRVWEGVDQHGVRCALLIARVVVSNDEPAAAHRRFAEELQETRAPTVAWPTRLHLSRLLDAAAAIERHQLDPQSGRSNPRSPPGPLDGEPPSE